jgi:hypothetical protein
LFSDGTNGFLMDFIERPDELELRLEIYNTQQQPLVLKEWLPLSDFSNSSNQISMGSMQLTLDSCFGNYVLSTNTTKAK